MQISTMLGCNSFRCREVIKIIVIFYIALDVTELTKAREMNEVGGHDQQIHQQVKNNSSNEDPRSKSENTTRALLRRVKRGSSNNGDVTALLDEMLHEDNYDRRRRPDNKGKPVIVKVGIWVIALDSINVIDMDFKMDFFLRQLWIDPRLAHMQGKTFTISNRILNRIWLPDTYFVNSKESKFHKVTLENKLLEIATDGLVHFNSRVTVKPSCHMDLRMFPNDVQKCNLDIESYSYNEKDVILQWEDRSDGGFGIPLRDLPQHNISQTLTMELRTQYMSGNWSGIRAEITIKRKMGYFLVHVYSPSALIVVLSWISFCIPLESTAARVTLGITSVLTTTTILNILNNSMPKVSYVKAIDWYLICCFMFVFGVLVEYTIVLYLDNLGQRKRKREEIRKKLEREEKAKEEAKRPFKNEPKKKHIYAQIRKEGEVATYVHGDPKPKKKRLHIRIKEYLLRLTVRDIDELARIFFPLTFMLFNAVYWLVFLS
ncbi:gamma-aminobutyric acid receptor subunit beta-2-like [Dendronephthya gigantea]|uniref:gamma-aminobutyric acid receptor subunit beta-2-like n=1 Tax=Dendronephthya gigantea TaxID=151771 RepID=UPI00106D957B|nr:gamma-aminobutyric acid receptor subunit beta-2-like [Dendronephthya gigantea]XP_028395782.1 gamma-aminobutyric acid receptor subunit beta-2-like [Dendronephthya gigantea]